MSRTEDLELARTLARTNEMDQAYVIANRYLLDNPNDVSFLTVMVYVMLGSDKPTIAYHLASRVAAMAPKDPAVWVNMGMACQDLWLSKEAERAYKKGIRLAPEDDQKVMLMVNLCALHIDTGRFEQAEPYANQVLAIDPEHKKGLANLGFCQLAQRNWKEGWVNYRQCIGHNWRPRNQYNKEPDWDGKDTDNLVIYAEQGLGDVISFASLLPYALEHSKKLVLDVDPRLAGLIQRSFPKAKVYGTRGKRELNWDKEDHDISASLPMGQIAEYCRLKDEDFPGTPYLKVDADRSYMWQQLFKSKKKPVIGIGWRGGILKTGAKYRQWDLEQLVPLLKSVDAHWVSLQYKSAKKEITEFKKKYPEIDIVEYPHGTLTNDYDDTAALVSALDRVICMQSAVTHLCGAIGKPAWVFVPQNSQWRYGGDREDFVWANSVRIVRQEERGKWDKDIDRIAGELSALYAGIPEATEDSAQSGKLRDRRGTLRTNGQSDHRQGEDRPSA